MGYIRFFLACIIMMHHVPPLGSGQVVHAELAFRAFFFISGYGIASSLAKRRIKNESAMRFYKDRAKAIYPLYLSVLAAIVGISAINYFGGGASALNAVSQYQNAYGALPFPESIYQLGNVFVRNSTLLITDTYWQYAPIRPTHLIMTQAWTIQIQLLFYLFAPWIVRMSMLLKLMLLLCSICLYGLLGPLIAEIKPYGYSITLFFLYYLHAFIGGIMSYHLQTTVYFNKLRTGTYFLAILGFFVPLASQFTNLYLPFENAGVIVFSLAAVHVLPLLSRWKQHTRLEQLFGSLAYPLFLVHLFTYKLVLGLFHTPSLAASLVTYSVSIAFAFGLYKIGKTMQRPTSH